MMLGIRETHRPFVLAISLAPLLAVTGVALVKVADLKTGLGDAVYRELSSSGVSNPVTAVLLNFRSFDTLLEVAVLLVAVVGARIATAGIDCLPQPAWGPYDDTVLRGYVRFIAPLLVLVAGYLLWVGSTAPGGAFQAGAVLASLGVLLRLARYRSDSWYTDGVERGAVVSGLAVFIVVGISTAAAGNAFLQYPQGWSKTLIVLIELACTVAIGAMLLGLYERLGAHVSGESSSRNPEADA